MTRTSSGSPASITSAPSGPGVEFVEITTTLGGKTVLDRLSLSAPAGQITVVMGASGEGKTTLMRHLLGLRAPDSGSVLVDGRSVWEMRPRELTALRQTWGVLLGGATVYEGGIFGSSNVFDNVAYPLRALSLSPDVVAERTWNWLGEFDLTEVAELMPAALAAGTRRRVALAKAFVAEPSLIVLDDPTAAIDIANRAAIAGSIGNAAARTRATVVAMTHSIQLARDLGQHLALMLDGRVLVQGPPRELLAGVDDGTDLDRRFHISGSFADPDPDTVDEVATSARTAGEADAWALFVVTLLVGLAIVLGLLLGPIDNPGGSSLW